MEEWFTKEIIDQDTCILSEYRHWEETHCYLLQGQERSLLIDTGLGICSIYDQVRILTDQPVTAVAHHVHWDHIGGHQYFPDFYAHEAELSWLQGSFPLTVEQVRRMVADRAVCHKTTAWRVTPCSKVSPTPAATGRGLD